MSTIPPVSFRKKRSNVEILGLRRMKEYPD
jgi:hypothetical protein